MKPKILRSIIGITLAIALVGGGFTLAWFSAKDGPQDNQSFTTGSVDIEIIDALFSPDVTTEPSPESLEWKPGVEQRKNFTWALENKGSKKAYFRTRLIEEMRKTESATGKGLDFYGNNWFMYFEVNRKESSKVVDLVSGRNHEKVGSVEVRVDRVNKTVSVKYKADTSIRITETHLAIKNDWRHIDHANGNPIPGKTEFSSNHDLVDEHTYSGLQPQNVNLTQNLYIFAHAVVVDVENDSWEVTLPNIDWTSDTWTYKDDWWYYCQPVMPGQVITLDLIACHFNDEKDGSYTVKIEAEAVQATNDAINKVWPDNPCRGL